VFVLQHLVGQKAVARQLLGARQAAAGGLQAISLHHLRQRGRVVAPGLPPPGTGGGHGLVGCCRRARASSCWACRLDLQARQHLPACTKSPSRTRTSCRRPASLPATAISVASMRPLPLTRPSGGPLERQGAQSVSNSAAPATTAAVLAQFFH
jgi:hypothetical protein